MQLYPTIKIKNDVAFTCSQPNGTLFRLQIHKPSKDNILFSDKFLQTEDVMSNFFFLFCKGPGAKSSEVGTAILPCLPGANSHRSTCPESGLCDAGVYTIWVCTSSDIIVFTLLNHNC